MLPNSHMFERPALRSANGVRGLDGPADHVADRGVEDKGDNEAVQALLVSAVYPFKTQSLVVQTLLVDIQ